MQQGQMFGLAGRATAAGRFFLRRCRARGGSGTTVRGSTTRPGIAPAASAWRSAATAKRSATLFVGDTLFAGSIGRTDLPGGDLATLLRSIRDVLFTFPGRHGRLSRARRADDDRDREDGRIRSSECSDCASRDRRGARPGRRRAGRPPSAAPCVDPLAVDERAVGALEVHDLELGRPGGQPAVQPRHQRRIDDEVGARRAADRLDAARQNAEGERRVCARRRS